MTPYALGTRFVVCIGCKRRRRTKNPARDICPRCERSDSQTEGRTDGNAAETPVEQLCQVRDDSDRPHYIKRGSYEMGVCSSCSHFGPIHEQPTALCKTCHQKKLSRLSKEALKLKVKCAVCSKMRRSVCLNENICLADYLARVNGYGVCVACGKEKLTWVKKGGARCRYCYKNQCAARSLRMFVKEYLGPNLSYFSESISRVDWDAVDEKTNRRFRAFGKFLQTISLPDPLTWESIEAAMPAFGSRNRANLKDIRRCLSDLAHHRVEQGLLEPREVYLARRIILHQAASAPVCFQKYLSGYIDWLAKLNYSSETVHHYLVSIIPFLSWCDARGIRCLSQVSAHLFEEYEQFLTWTWICERCNINIPFDLYGATPECNACDAVGVMCKTRRYPHARITIHCKALRNFFHWGEVNDLGPNPIPPVRTKDTPFRHYPDDVIKQLAQYVVSPSTAPLEALVLYLTIFHAFSVWELAHALLPTAGTNRSPMRCLCDDYCVLLPPRAVSRRNLSPGRPSARIEFPASAAAWLKPLLQRYERWRIETLDNPNNEYLLVAPGRARHVNPVCQEFVRRVVKRGSMKAGVGECSPKRLRTTAAVMYADSGVTGILTWLGWSASRGFKYTWSASREVVYPRQRAEASQWIPAPAPSGGVSE